MDNDDFARLTAALRTVGAELDALSHRVDALTVASRGGQPVASGAPPACTGNCPLAERYRLALRDAVEALERTRNSFKSKELGALRRSLETLLFEAPR